MAAYLYRMAFKALVITSVLIFACQLAVVVAAARAVPADHSSAPVIGSLYRRTRRQPKPELLNNTRDPEPDNKRDVRGPRRWISFGGLTELKAARQIPGRNRRQDHRGRALCKREGRHCSDHKRSQDLAKICLRILSGAASGTPSTFKRSRSRGTKEVARMWDFFRHRFKPKALERFNNREQRNLRRKEETGSGEQRPARRRLVRA
ncbi:hypothetical protein GOBAR_DD30861 [Gossypium barbadense]|nr:hypothetical protein GOBAR_DD30861 [Gossypium barbadense]